MRSETSRIAAISANVKPQKRRLELGQFAERLIEPLQLLCLTERMSGGLLVAGERDLELPAALLSASVVHVVDEKAAHRA